jgi:hypothetical protein
MTDSAHTTEQSTAVSARYLPRESLGMICAELVRPYSRATLHRAHAFALLACLLVALMNGMLLFLKLYFNEDAGSASPLEWIRQSATAPTTSQQPSSIDSPSTLPACPLHLRFLLLQAVLALVCMFGSFAHLVLCSWAGLGDDDEEEIAASVLGGEGSSTMRSRKRKGLVAELSDSEEEEDLDEEQPSLASSETALLHGDDDGEEEEDASPGSEKKDVRRNTPIRWIVYASTIAMLAYSSASIVTISPSLLSSSACAPPADLPPAADTVFQKALGFNLLVLALPLVATVLVVVAKMRGRA